MKTKFPEERVFNLLNLILKESYEGCEEMDLRCGEINDLTSQVVIELKNYLNNLDQSE